MGRASKQPWEQSFIYPRSCESKILRVAVPDTDAHLRGDGREGCNLLDALKGGLDCVIADEFGLRIEVGAAVLRVPLADVGHYCTRKDMGEFLGNGEVVHNAEDGGEVGEALGVLVGDVFVHILGVFGCLTILLQVPCQTLQRFKGLRGQLF